MYIYILYIYIYIHIIYIIIYITYYSTMNHGVDATVFHPRIWRDLEIHQRRHWLSLRPDETSGLLGTPRDRVEDGTCLMVFKPRYSDIV